MNFCIILSLNPRGKNLTNFQMVDFQERTICPISGTCHNSQESDNNVFHFSSLKCSGTCQKYPLKKWLHILFSVKIKIGFLPSSWILWVLKQASTATASLSLPLASSFSVMELCKTVLIFLLISSILYIILVLIK